MYMIWFVWVLWPINRCRLFNAKSDLYTHTHTHTHIYIYIYIIWLGWVGFYGISTIVSYLMPNPIYTYFIMLSSCRASSTDIPDPLSPLFPIVHRPWQVFRSSSRILTELLYECSTWPSCFCSAIYRGP